MNPAVSKKDSTYSNMNSVRHLGLWRNTYRTTFPSTCVCFVSSANYCRKYKNAYMLNTPTI